MYSYIFPIIKNIFVEFVKIVQQNPSLICERQWTPRLETATSYSLDT
jgi:hypothetical protein